MPAPATRRGRRWRPCGLRLHGGKELSYNNLVDLVAALKLVADHGESCCAVIKHTNPCGFGLGARRRRRSSARCCAIPVSAFGGIYAFNREVDDACAAALRRSASSRWWSRRASRDERAGAPDAARRTCASSPAELPVFAAATRGRLRVFGRLALHQDEDEGFPELATWRVVAGDGARRGDAARAHPGLDASCKHGKSNAIVLASARRDRSACGFGQMSRVDSVKLAVRKAGEQGLDLAGCVAASDGFFPLPGRRRGTGARRRRAP